jgi:hypothetical protein
VFSLQGQVAIQRGADSRAIIAYSNGELGTLKAAKCLVDPCTGAVVSLLRDAAGSPVSLSIGGDGNALIAYLDNGAPTVLHCLDSNCTSATNGAALPPQPGGFGGYYDFSIGTTTEGKGLLAFRDAFSPWGLWAAHCEGADYLCSTSFSSP